MSNCIYKCENYRNVRSVLIVFRHRLGASEGILRGTEALGNFGGRRSANPSEPPYDQNLFSFLLYSSLNRNKVTGHALDFTMAFAGQTPTIVVLKEGLCSTLSPPNPAV